MKEGGVSIPLISQVLLVSLFTPGENIMGEKTADLLSTETIYIRTINKFIQADSVVLNISNCAHPVGNHFPRGSTGGIYSWKSRTQSKER